MKSLIEHYEEYLGAIQHGWSRSADATEMPFQVVECRGGPFQGISVFATAGMSRKELMSATSRMVIRQELLFAAPTDFGSRNIPGLLQQIGTEAIVRGLAYLRGDVIGPRGCLLERKAFEAVYVTMPVYFPEALKTCKSDEEYDIVIAWLVPITRPEALYVREHGWNSLKPSSSKKTLICLIWTVRACVDQNGLLHRPTGEGHS